MAESETNRFFRKLFGFSLGPIINAALGFISVPITTWLILPDELGRASMFTTAHGLINMFVYLGLDAAYQRHYHEIKDHSILLFHALLPPALVAGALSAGMLVAYPFVSMALYGVRDFFPVAMLGLYIIIHMVMHYGQYMLLMRERAKSYSVGQVLEKVSRVAALVGFMLLYERSFRSVLLASLTSQLIASIYHVALTWRFWKISWKFDRELLGSMFRYGLPLVPAAALAWVFNSIDKIAIRTWATFDEIGIYAGAFKLVAALAIVRKSFGSFWPPVALRWYHNDAPAHRYQRVSDTLFSVMAAMYACIVLARNIVYYILSPAYAASASLVPFLLFIPLMSTVSETTMLGITFSKKTHLHVVVTAVSAVVNVAGNALLVPRYGALGAAVSTGISFNVFFWMRGLLSARHWPVLDFRFHAMNSALMLAMATVSIVPISWARVVEWVIAVAVIVVNRQNLWDLVMRLRRSLVSTPQRRRG